MTKFSFIIRNTLSIFHSVLSFYSRKYFYIHCYLDYCFFLYFQILPSLYRILIILSMLLPVYLRERKLSTSCNLSCRFQILFLLKAERPYPYILLILLYILQDNVYHHCILGLFFPNLLSILIYLMSIETTFNKI